MKLLKLLFALLFAVSMTTVSAQPNNALCMVNNAGGTMVLTKVKSPAEENAYVSISTTERGRAIYGYWSLIGEFTIMIIWLPNGETSMFDVSAFVPCRL